VRRRDFVKVIAVSVAWPLAASAQQPAIPVVGYLSANSPDEGEPRAAAFRRGLQEAGYVVARTLRSNTAGQSNKLIGCPRWRQIWLNVM
jgi:putative tryptophan/tyrosine transport system substrate-binding protein